MCMNYMTSFIDFKTLDVFFYETKELHIKANMFHAEAEVNNFVKIVRGWKIFRTYSLSF